MLLQTIGDLIKAKRVSLGLSQDELAERAGVTRSFIYRVESARSSPTVEVFAGIARGLNMRGSALLAEAEKKVEEQFRSVGAR